MKKEIVRRRRNVATAENMNDGVGNAIFDGRREPSARTREQQTLAATTAGVSDTDNTFFSGSNHQYVEVGASAAEAATVSYLRPTHQQSASFDSRRAAPALSTSTGQVLTMLTTSLLLLGRANICVNKKVGGAGTRGKWSRSQKRHSFTLFYFICS